MTKVIFDQLSDIISLFLKNSKLLVITDNNVHLHCYELIKKELPLHEIIVLDAGEQVKSILNCSLIWNLLIEKQFSKSDYLLSLGGGTISDLTGFVASTYKRGLTVMHVPTTLLSIIDAAHGGKTALNMNGVKNTIGTFYFPKFVFINSIFLNTLPKNELNSGFGEALKHAILKGKIGWEFIKKSEPNHIVWNNIILKYFINVKLSIVEKDPLENKERVFLNLGHTTAHAIESVFNSFSAITHGHAVALGLAVETCISLLLKSISISDANDILNQIKHHFTIFPLLKHENELLEFIKQDKKNAQSTCFVVPTGIGTEPKLVFGTDYFNSALTYYENWYATN